VKAVSYRLACAAAGRQVMITRELCQLQAGEMLLAAPKNAFSYRLACGAAGIT
jgi:hypothetical protein